jgi:hypothetical protein
MITRTAGIADPRGVPQETDVAFKKKIVIHDAQPAFDQRGVTGTIAVQCRTIDTV